MENSQDVNEKVNRPVGSDLPQTGRSRSKKDVEVFTTEHPDQDVALFLVGEHATEIDHVVEARVIRKIDRFLIPAMIAGYGFVYYDKV